MVDTCVSGGPQEGMTELIPYDEAAHDAFFAATEARTRVENNTTNLRFLFTALYTGAGGVPADPQSDAWGDYMDCLLDAAEGRPFIPFDTKRNG